jgi:His-Xaa-Ser system protein (TIGR03982 family)
MKNLFRTIVGTFAVFWLLKEIAVPGFAALLLSSKYMKQTISCDQAMEAHWYGQKSVLDAKAAEVQLLSCHNYDETRKLLLLSGLPEEYLSWLGLKSLDIYQRPASELTEAHKFRDR